MLEHGLYNCCSLIRTSWLPVVDWTDTPADLNGLVHFAETPNLVSARVPSRFECAIQLVVVGDNMQQVVHKSFRCYSGDKLMCRGKEGNELWNPYWQVFRHSCATSVFQQKSGNTWKHWTSPTAKEFEVCQSVFCNAAGFSHVKFMHQGMTSSVNTRFGTLTSVSGYLRNGHQSWGVTLQHDSAAPHSTYQTWEWFQSFQG